MTLLMNELHLVSQNECNSLYFLTVQLNGPLSKKQFRFWDFPCESETVIVNEKRIKTENIQDKTSQKIFDLETLVFYLY